MSGQMNISIFLESVVPVKVNKEIDYHKHVTMFLQGWLQSNGMVSGFTQIVHNTWVFFTGNLVTPPSILESFK